MLLHITYVYLYVDVFLYIIYMHIYLYNKRLLNVFLGSASLTLQLLYDIILLITSMYVTPTLSLIMELCVRLSTYRNLVS